MRKEVMAQRMQRLLQSLPEPGEASGSQPYNITMFKMSLLMFLATDRIRILTWVLAVLTLALIALTVVLVIK